MQTTILEDLLSRDATRIWQACDAVRNLRDRAEISRLIANLDEIRFATKNVKLGGMLRPNSTHLEFAIKKLELLRDETICLCRLYPLDDMFDPEREQNAGNIFIEKTAKTDENFIDQYICKCLVCSSSYRVTEREYHYTWWKWELLPNFGENDS